MKTETREVAKNLVG